MAHWKNVTKGENLVRTQRRKGFPFIKMMSYLCYCWTTKWHPIFATVEPQNDLYLRLLNHKMTSCICYCWTTKWPSIFATVESQNDVLCLLLLNHKMMSYICYCWTTQSMIMSEDWNHQATWARCLSRLWRIGLWRKIVWWVAAAIPSETAAFIFTAALNP